LVLVKIIFIEATVNVVKVRIILDVFFFKNSLVVVHVFGFSEVGAFFVCDEMQ
jgi:hypothetical protein